MKKALNAAAGIFIAFMFFSFVGGFYLGAKYTDNQIGVNSLQARVDSLQSAADSLHSENFPCQIELSRYQTAYEIFQRRNPKAASQYGTIISEETE
jgi:hypothetical protein